MCATSNSACDEIAQRLLKFIPTQHNKTELYNLYRLYASSINKDSPEQSILDSSNFFDKFYPPLQTLYRYRIIIGTLGVAGRLGNKRENLGSTFSYHCHISAQARISADHFTHLFIDECGSATESASLIPIAGKVLLFINSDF